jgi:sodium/bile acid cotransporter 7
MYEDNPNVGLYTLPLLIWHPMQLVIGSFLAPRLAAFVERKEAALLLTATPEEATSELPVSTEHDEETPLPADAKQ